MRDLIFSSSGRAGSLKGVMGAEKVPEAPAERLMWRIWGCEGRMLWIGGVGCGGWAEGAVEEAGCGSQWVGSESRCHDGLVVMLKQ